MNRLYIDVETYSPLDLSKHGVKRYASAPGAGIHCIAYAFNNEPVKLINSESRQYGNFAAWLRICLNDFKIVAHNALFELEIFRTFLGVDIDLKNVIDTMAKCAYYGYPQGLDEAAQALACAKLKDLQGKAVMKQLGLGTIKRSDDPTAFDRLYEYCKTDVEVMRMIDQKLPDLPQDVQNNWELDAEINLRGIPVDVIAVDNAIKLKAIVSSEANAKMSAITGGIVNAVTEVQKLGTFIRDRGVETPNCNADSINRLLGAGGLPSDVRQALELRQQAGLTSLAKYEKIAAYEHAGRLHHMFRWYGAHTGRPSGRGPQVMNLPRSEEPEFFAEMLNYAPDLLPGFPEPAKKLKEAVRGCIKAQKGKVLLGVDLAQIEARATGWVSGEQKFLELFMTSDPYCTYGKTIFGREINKKDHMIERTAAKASMLSLGFAGGIGAYQRVAENYHIDFSMVSKVVLPFAEPHEIATARRNYEYYLKKNPVKPLNETDGFAVDILKQRYRRDFPNIETYWDQLEQAFLLGGKVGMIEVEVKPGALHIMTLPSGRQLFYHGVHIHKDGKYSYQDGFNRRKFLWKGTLIENVAQAINADVSNWYKANINEWVGPVIHHCYDEITIEVDKDKAEEALFKLKSVTQNEKPEWANGLPLGFDYWVGERYGK